VSRWPTRSLSMFSPMTTNWYDWTGAVLRDHASKTDDGAAADLSQQYAYARGIKTPGTSKWSAKLGRDGPVTSRIIISTRSLAHAVDFMDSCGSSGKDFRQRYARARGIRVNGNEGCRHIPRDFFWLALFSMVLETPPYNRHPFFDKITVMHSGSTPKGKVFLFPESHPGVARILACNHC
jgi:hypothetical protein